MRTDKRVPGTAQAVDKALTLVEIKDVLKHDCVCDGQP